LAADTIFIALVIFCVEATEAILARISFSDAIFFAFGCWLLAFGYWQEWPVARNQ